MAVRRRARFSPSFDHLSSRIVPSGMGPDPIMPMVPTPGDVSDDTPPTCDTVMPMTPYPPGDEVPTTELNDNVSGD